MWFDIYARNWSVYGKALRDEWFHAYVLCSFNGTTINRVPSFMGKRKLEMTRAVNWMELGPLLKGGWWRYRKLGGPIIVMIVMICASVFTFVNKGECMYIIVKVRF